jgi:hypothetical protein
MGHHAQYRKRGSNTVVLQTVTAPPPPVLSIDGSDVLTTTTGGGDGGGRYIIYESKDGGVTYPESYVANWEPVHRSPQAGFFAPCKLRAIERGNGTAYLGDSSYSNVLTLA